MGTEPVAVQSRALLEAGWPEVLDRLLQGIGHDLNNRVQTLLSLVQLLQLDEDVTSLTPFLEKEVGQLETAVSLLRLIPGAPEEEPELVSLTDFVPPILSLHEVQKHLEPVVREWVVEPEGLMPVRAPWTLLGRTVLVLLAAAATEAMSRDRRLEVRARSDEGEPVLEAEAVGGLGGGTPPEPSAAVEGIGPLAETLGARFEIADAEASRTYRLTFPSPIRS